MSDSLGNVDDVSFVATEVYSEPVWRVLNVRIVGTSKEDIEHRLGRAVLECLKKGRLLCVRQSPTVVVEEDFESMEPVWRAFVRLSYRDPLTNDEGATT